MVENKVYVDVNVFVYWLGRHPKLGKTAYKWIREIEESKRGKYLTSSITIYETLLIIAGLTGKTLRDKELVKEVVSSITSLRGLSIEPLKPEDLASSLDLMQKYGLDYEDSLHLSTAIRTGAKEIISNDKDFDKTPLKRRPL
ncbi:MAG: type II toxin-antitoxin system VapC family toxin [Thaumarchaeota archaeon]|nr:type II toxin-antitoxin system VapC family toxin [Nitrososphaerota archaeon]